ncbi:MAG TPA: proton-conducting transporter membrane subunit [Thermomicrobiales bacterium]|nr:proton-conducting transporter membrane subunit [Thermomicrobiales bacterium]
MTLAALTILAPLAAAALILVVRRGAAALALLGAAVGAAAALGTLARVAGGARFAATLPGLPGLPLRLAVDPLAAAFAATVAVVTLVVLIYAVGYMAGEAGQPRFFAGMAFFAAAMQGLVLAGDWVLFLVAWELIGLASYLLIGFWFARPGVGAAATRAFVTTRAADLGLYVGVFLLATRAGTTAIAPTLGVGGAAATVAGLLLLLAAAGKSAQAPFQGWLQDAMVGPTPVSALLHSAALVAAGAVLLLRAAPLLTGPARLAVGLVGGVTALVAGLTALAQGDLKRLLASSTSSQLGFVFLAVGAGAPVAALAHLVAHAAMKGALFLGAGVFQHARESTAFDRLGGVGRAHRRVYAGFVVAGLALAGVPPLAGFWSKDAVVAATVAAPDRWALAPVALLGTLLTGGYVARALRLLWQGGGERQPVRGLGWMGAGLAALAALAATLGLAVRPLARLLGADVPEDLAATLGALLLALAGLAAGATLPAARLLGPLRGWAAAGFRVGEGFDGLVVRPALALAHLADRLDHGIHGGVLAMGRAALGVAGAARALGRVDEGVVAGVGRLGLALARAARWTDEDAIDALVAGLVRRTRDLGGRARRAQTGLVHQELLVAGGGALLLVLLLVGGLLWGR